MAYAMPLAAQGGREAALLGAVTETRQDALRRIERREDANESGMSCGKGEGTRKGSDLTCGIVSARENVTVMWVARHSANLRDVRQPLRRLTQGDDNFRKAADDLKRIIA